MDSGDLESKIEEERICVFEEYELRPDEYTTAIGSYCEWRTNVDLGPPDDSVPVPAEDDTILNYYNALQYSLYENNLPETIDRTSSPRTQYTKHNIAIALLSSPVECLAFLLEGARACPGDMLLVMSTSWLHMGAIRPGSHTRSMYVRKAILFDTAGRSYIDVFEPPRKVTYFVNFFTRACTNGQRHDGEELEANLDCPMSSSLNLVKMVDDKLWTRILMAEADVCYPETLSFAYKSDLSYKVPSGASITVVRLDTKTGVNNLILDEIQRFVESEDVSKCSKIVVKPSGTVWHGSMGVTYHDSKDTCDIWRAAVNLLADIEPGNCIMAETFYSYENTNDNKQNEFSFRLRSNACRRPDDVGVATTAICGIAKKDKPINGDNTVPQSLHSTLRQFGFSKIESRRIQDEVSVGSANVMNKIIQKEKLLNIKERGEVGAQTDVIGIDFVLGKKNGKVSPIGIEVNSHDCTINCQLYESMNKELSGQSVRPMVNTMINRSQKFLLHGKHLLVIGAGGYSKRFIWKSSKELGVKVILVDSKRDSYTEKNVSYFLHYDFNEHIKDETHARNIIQILKVGGFRIDGCVTFWEDCGPLAASVCTKLGLNGAGLIAAQTAKNKTLTHKLLITRDEDIPHFPRTYLYAAKTVHIDHESDIKPGIDEVGLPALLKLEYGSSAVGVKLICDSEECHREFQHIKRKLQVESDHPGIGLGHGNSMQLMEYVDGTEHDIDIIIFKRKLIAAFVSDNGPTRLNSFTETAASMPTFLPPDKKAQLITAAYTCCNETGLVSGVFNVEMKMTRTGPKLLEINARMGGFYLRDWIKACYGVDLLFCAYLIACGIKPILPPIIEPRGHIMGIMCLPSIHRSSLSDPQILHQLAELRNKGEVRFNQFEATLDESDEELEEPYCNIAVMESNLEQAKYRLLNICETLGIDRPDYPVRDFLVDFNEDIW